MPSIHEGHRYRTKEEFLVHSSSFPDHRVLEILLFYSNPQRDTNPLAHTLLDQFGSVAGVLDARPEELKKIPGIGDHTLCLLKAVKEMSGRYLQARVREDTIVSDSKVATSLLRPYFFGARVERTALLCMDARRRNLGIRVISEGSVNATQVTARSIVETALCLNSSMVILAHNHVSGFALPSVEDKMTTLHLAKVLKSVDVELTDHLILTDDEMFSFLESGFDFWQG